MPTPLVTTDDLETFQSGDAQSAIDAATAIVRAYCGWHVSPSVEETITVKQQKPTVAAFILTFLPSLHVTALTSVMVDGVEVVGFTDNDWTENGILLRADGAYYWPYSSNRIATIIVEITHGWAPEDVPDFVSVVLALASRTQTSPQGGVVQQVGQVRYATQAADDSTPFLVSELAILDKYRIVSVS